jgi:hypothetical protein
MKNYLNIIQSMLNKVKMRDLLKVIELKIKEYLAKVKELKIKEYLAKVKELKIKEYLAKVKELKIKEYLAKVKELKLKEYLSKVKNHITMKHVYVSAIVLFQLLAILCLFVNIYYVITFIALYTICTIALFIYLYQKEVKLTRSTTKRFNKTETM